MPGAELTHVAVLEERKEIADTAMQSRKLEPTEPDTYSRFGGCAPRVVALQGEAIQVWKALKELGQFLEFGLSRAA